jgi:GTPase
VVSSNPGQKTSEKD